IAGQDHPGGTPRCTARGASAGTPGATNRRWATSRARPLVDLGRLLGRGHWARCLPGFTGLVTAASDEAAEQRRQAHEADAQKAREAQEHTRAHTSTIASRGRRKRLS